MQLQPGGAGLPKAKPSARSSENAQKSLIGDFLSQDIPNIVAEQENAIAGLETALKRKPFEGQSRGIEGQ